jgi:hypothetical protein
MRESSRLRLAWLPDRGAQAKTSAPAVMGSVDGWAVDPWIQLRVLGCQVGSKSVCWTFQAWMRGASQNK